MSDLVLTEDEVEGVQNRRAVRNLLARALGPSVAVPNFAALKALYRERGVTVESQDDGPLGALPKTDQLQAILPVLFGLGEEVAEYGRKYRADGEHEQADGTLTEARYIWEVAAYVASAVRTNRQAEADDRRAADPDPVDPEF